MSGQVRFAPQAERDLIELVRLHRLSRGARDRRPLHRRTHLLLESLATLPDAGTPRDDIRPGLRTIGFRGRVAIAFATIDDAVVILGVYYGGRHYETLLSEPDE